MCDHKIKKIKKKWGVNSKIRTKIFFWKCIKMNKGKSIKHFVAYKVLNIEEILFYNNLKFWYLHEFLFSLVYKRPHLSIKNLLDFWEIFNRSVINYDMAYELSEKEWKKRIIYATNKMFLLNKINLLTCIKKFVLVDKQLITKEFLLNEYGTYTPNVLNLQRSIGRDYTFFNDNKYIFSKSYAMTMHTNIVNIIKFKHLNKHFFFFKTTAANPYNFSGVEHENQFPWTIETNNYNRWEFQIKWFKTFYWSGMYKNTDYLTDYYKTYYYYPAIDSPVAKLYSNKLYSNLYLIKLHSKILFYTIPYEFCEPFLINKHYIQDHTAPAANVFDIPTSNKDLIDASYDFKNLHKFLERRKSLLWHKNIYSTNFPTSFRFRPGYSKLWRRARKTLKKLYRIHSPYQHLLTKHLSKIYKYSSAHRILINHYELESVIITLNFAQNKFTSREIIHSGFLLINFDGIEIRNKTGFYHLYPHDLLQFVICWWIYLYWHQNNKINPPLTKKYVLKWLLELKKPYKKPRKKTLFKIYHQLYSAFWDVYKNKNDFIILFEIDYSLGWIYTLLTPIYWWETNPISLIHEPFFDAKVYNWKYIT